MIGSVTNLNLEPMKSFLGLFQSNETENTNKPKKYNKQKIEKKLVEKYPTISKDEKLKSQYLDLFTDKEKFIEQFLDTDWTNTIKQVQKAKTEILEKKKSMYPSSKSDEVEEEEEEEFSDFDTTEIQLFNNQTQKTFEKALPIKFVVTEIMQSKAQKQMRELVAPVLSTLNISPEFGMFHVALLIGPWIIEWNDSALCVPRKAVSQAALLTTDIGEIATKSNVKEIVSKITDVIMDWNLGMDYDNNPRDKNGLKGNCHDFVEAVLERIDLKPEFPGAMGQFLKKMKSTGKCDLTFEPDLNFVNQCNLKKKTTFKTHEELDLFVNQILSGKDFKNMSEFKEKRPGDYALLKSFDRAFWLRKMHAENKKRQVDDKYLPLYIIKKEGSEHKKHLGCPFGDPIETLSVLQ